MGELKIKRVYEAKQKTDGVRILVDRLWPRGVKKSAAHLDYWCKEIAPSTELRKFFGHDPNNWKEFKKLYFKELKSKNKLLDCIYDMLSHSNVTLVIAAKDPEYNHGIALQAYINRKYKL